MYQEENRKQRFITMGEIMLRLTPPDCEKIRTADCFEARYGGSEANVALSLANLGVPELTEELLEKSGLKIADIDFFILHQANERIVKAAAKKLKVDMSRFPINMENYANTSAASIPILLDELVQTGRLRKGQKILLAGFGAGLTWAGSILEW